MVNENDKIIGMKLYKDIDFPNEIYRVSRVWITDREGNSLLQKRNPEMRFHAGLWACAAAGTNDEGETYESNIIKEAKEEIGIDLDPACLKRVKKTLERNSGRNVWCTYFEYQLRDVMPTIVKDVTEVAETKWFNPGELKELLKTDPEIFTPDIAGFVS